MAGRAKLHPNKSKQQSFDTDILWSIDRTRAALGGIHRTTVIRMLNAGKLTGMRIGVRRMVTVASVKALIREQLPDFEEAAE
jgi:hypothetical protein